ncbi:MAG: GatB/YqeY domain-containing protein [Actinomycetota bacterium]
MLRDQIPEELKEAMKARDSVRVSTLRLLLTAMKNAKVERMHELEDDEVLEIASKEAKRRRESIEAFTNAGRTDLAEKESAELAVLQSYLPEEITEAELSALVDQAIAESGATGPQQMGLVMKALMPKVKGRADGAVVSALVKSKLAG